MTVVHYLPIATTLISIPFAIALVRRYRDRGSGIHLLWWAAGVACYGIGTALESAITLSGNTIALNKSWYIAGALLGAYPLSQGTVYLLFERKRAHLLTWITVPFVALLAALVVLSPVNAEALEGHRPSGAILEWSWVRLLTPLINLYAVAFLVGGAIASARRYAVGGEAPDKVVGNSLIAVGAILPAIGGSIAKGGMVEALYVAELVGLVTIWCGFRYCTRPSAPSVPPVG